MEIPLGMVGRRAGGGEFIFYEISSTEHLGKVPRRIAAGSARLPMTEDRLSDLDLTMRIPLPQ
jgi:hypothetical protein